MVQIIELTRDISIAPQIVEGDVAEIRARGFRSIFNVRPDDETGEYPKSAEIEKVALAHGLGWRFLPTPGLCITDEDKVEAFGRMFTEIPAPVLAYCKSGTRAALLWAQAMAGPIPVARIIDIAAAAGLDFELIYEELNEREEAYRQELARRAPAAEHGAYI